MKRLLIERKGDEMRDVDLEERGVSNAADADCCFSIIQHIERQDALKQVTTPRHTQKRDGSERNQTRN